VTDNWPTVEPYFNETGSNSPSILPTSQQRELLELAVKSVQAVGFTMGVYHVECKYTSHGPRLIEINCRMGGGPVRNMNLLVWGVDMVEEQLLCTAGRSLAALFGVFYACFLSLSFSFLYKRRAGPETRYWP
jgi:biotin carboxylase